MENKNIPPFYVGQKVVATRSTPALTKGKEYIVTDNLFKGCCNSWTTCVGVTDTADAELLCIAHGVVYKGKYDKTYYHNSKYFAPLHSDFQSITLEKVLEKETPLIGAN